MKRRKKSKSFRTVLLELRERVTVPKARELIDHELEILCRKCGEPAQPDTDPPMCVDHMSQKGGGNDPETADEEMEAMEARDLNEDEGDK